MSDLLHHRATRRASSDATFRRRRRVTRAVAALLTVAAAGSTAMLAAPSADASRSLVAKATAPLVTVSPQPGSRTAPAKSQISFLGLPASKIGSVRVVGTRSGVHAGKIEAYSQGDGGSFVMNTPFTAGEKVTVTTGLNVAGGTNGSWSFAVVRLATAAPVHQGTAPKTSGAASGASGTASDVSTYVSDPSISPPKLTVDVHASKVAPGDVFLGPRGGTGQAGPMIADNSGFTVWFSNLGSVLNFKEQEYLGKPVLTWWSGNVIVGYGDGAYTIMNSSYHVVKTVHAGNGLQGDLHEFSLEPNGAALMTAYEPIQWDTSSVGGSKSGSVLDSIFQEVDVKTGLVRYEWNSLDRVRLAESYLTPNTGALDFFHINSIQPSGKYLIVSGRNTHGVYEILKSTGQIVWRLGGKASNFTMGTGTQFAWQHDAELHAGGLMTIFDDEASPNVAPPSRGILLQLDMTHMTATLDRQYVRNPSTITGSQGNMQELPNSDVMIGWGAQPFLTEFTSAGFENFDIELPAADSSYRVFRFPWVGTPTTKPALAVHLPSGSSTGTAYMSWNGATQVASWTVLGGSSSTTLAPVASLNRHGFETKTSVPADTVYEVEARDSTGAIIGTSPPVAPTTG
jgi:hypothetical protein